MSRIVQLWRPRHHLRLKTLTRCPLFCVLALLSIPSFAAREEATFNVSINLPSNDFYVLPINPHLLQRDQIMNYNMVTKRLSTLREHFDVKNALGGITARVEGEPVLSNGRDLIALAVTFNGQPLGQVNTLVVSDVDAKLGKRVLIEIAAVVPTDSYMPGEYFGSVRLMFDALQP